MSKFKHLGNYIEFANAYTVFFEAAGVAPYCIFAHIWHGGDKISMDQFTADNAGGFLSPENFAKLLYKVSRAPVPLEPKED